MNNNPQQSIDELIGAWEYEVTGVPKHWAKTPKRAAIDNNFKAALKEVVDGVIGESEREPYHIRSQIEVNARNNLRSEQRKRAAEIFGLE